MVGMGIIYKTKKSVGIPNKNFWTVLPKLVMVGCVVTFEWIKRKIKGEGGDSETDALVPNPTDE